MYLVYTLVTVALLRFCMRYATTIPPGQQAPASCNVLTVR